MNKVSFSDKFEQIREHWSPRIVGEFFIVPRGVEHQPVADKEVEVLLFEPAGTLNTGDVVNERTVEKPGRL